MITVRTIGIAALILGWVFLLHNYDKHSGVIEIDSHRPWPLIFFAIGTICTMFSNFFK